MRIGIVVDSACDVPTDFIERENVTILPVTVQIGQAVLADHRDEEATLNFLHDHVAKHGIDAETTPFTVQQVHDLFISQLVLDYDYVFCITTTRTRSGIHDNAQQASYTILNDYKPVRQAAGNNTPFSLRVIDSQNVFAAVGVLAIEAARLREAGEAPPKIRARLESLAQNLQGYMVPPDLHYLRNRIKKRGDKSVTARVKDAKRAAPPGTARLSRSLARFFLTPPAPSESAPGCGSRAAADGAATPAP